MKRSTIAKTLTVAAAAVLALSIAPTAKATDRGCSNITLMGTFSRTDTGTVLAPAAAVSGGAALAGARADPDARFLGRVPP